MSDEGNGSEGDEEDSEVDGSGEGDGDGKGDEHAEAVVPGEESAVAPPVVDMILNYVSRIRSSFMACDRHTTGAPLTLWVLAETTQEQEARIGRENCRCQESPLNRTTETIP
jgi:hypothetical protein